MRANQADFPIAAMARVLGVSKAGYYAWVGRQPSARAVANVALLKRIRTVHLGSRETYGAPRIHADLREQGERHSRKRIARLMRKAGLVGASHRSLPFGSMVRVTNRVDVCNARWCRGAVVPVRAGISGKRAWTRIADLPMARA